MDCRLFLWEKRFKESRAQWVEDGLVCTLPGAGGERQINGRLIFLSELS